MANSEWMTKFPFMQVKNNDTFHSDHRPIVIRLDGVLPGRQTRGQKPFQFEACWLQEENCRKIVEEAWSSGENSDGYLRNHLTGIARSLKEWSSSALGGQEKQLKVARRELERWRKQPISDMAVGREAVWSFKVDRLEEQIDAYWKQRAHINWLQFGDRNTSYFHHACSERRRNRIGNLKKNDGG